MSTTIFTRSHFFRARYLASMGRGIPMLQHSVQHGPRGTSTPAAMAYSSGTSCLFAAHAASAPRSLNVATEYDRIKDAVSPFMAAPSPDLIAVQAHAAASSSSPVSRLARCRRRPAYLAELCACAGPVRTR